MKTANLQSTRRCTTFGVVPAHNEQRAIARTVQGLCRYCDEVIVVDDGSHDDTAKLAKAAGAFVHSSKTSNGYSKAVIQGITLALRAGADIILTADGDGAHDVNSCNALLEEHLSRTAALTIGTRFLPLRGELNSTKVFANRVAAALVSGVYPHLRCPLDVASGCRAFSRKFASTLTEVQGELPHFGLCYFSILLAISRRERIISYPISVRYDGSQLLGTRTSEFLDCVDTLMPFANKRYRSILKRLKNAISKQETIRFELKSQIIYAVPVPHKKDYIFQLHSTCYDNDVIVKNLTIRMKGNTASAILQ